MGIRENLAKVRAEIENAIHAAGREAGSVKLVAVSKFHPASAVREAIESGQLIFGENRVQEASEKFPSLLNAFPKLELHLIGSLQRNKVRRALPISACIQSVDRKELLLEIERRAAEIEKQIDVLFEFHTGEESKSGYMSEGDLFSSIEELALSCPHVRARGLMTMAPFTDDEKEIRLAFKKLYSIQQECKRRYPSLNFDELSMGMSSDFRIAIEEGSTMVRVGTAIFGERR